MKPRPIMERPDVDLGAQYDCFSSKLTATGAQRIWIDGMEPEEVVGEILSVMRARRRFSR